MVQGDSGQVEWVHMISLETKRPYSVMFVTTACNGLTRFNAFPCVM